MTVSANVFTLNQLHAAPGTHDGEQTQTSCDPALFLALLSGCLGPAQALAVDPATNATAQPGVGAVESVAGPESAGAVEAVNPSLSAHAMPGAAEAVNPSPPAHAMPGAAPVQAGSAAGELVAAAGTPQELPTTLAQRPSPEPRVAVAAAGAPSADVAPRALPAPIQTSMQTPTVTTTAQSMAVGESRATTGARAMPAGAAALARPAEPVVAAAIPPNAADAFAGAEVVPARAEQPVTSTLPAASSEPIPARPAVLPQTSAAAARIDQPAAPVGDEALASEMATLPVDPAREAQTPARATQPGPARSVAPRIPERAAPPASPSVRPDDAGTLAAEPATQRMAAATQAQELRPTDLPLTVAVADGSATDRPAQQTLRAPNAPAATLAATPAATPAATLAATPAATPAATLAPREAALVAANAGADTRVAEAAAPTDTRPMDVQPRTATMPEAPRVAALAEPATEQAGGAAQISPTPVTSERFPIDGRGEPGLLVASTTGAPGLPGAVVFDGPEEATRLPEAVPATAAATGADARAEAGPVAQQPGLTQQRVSPPAVPAGRMTTEAEAPAVSPTADAGEPVTGQQAPEDAEPAVLDRAGDTPGAARTPRDMIAGMEAHTVLTRAAGGGAHATATEPTVTISEPVRVAAGELNAQQPMRLVVEVDPPELGRCELELSMHEGRVRAVLIAERPDTVAALRSVEGQVREQLAGRALQIAEFDVRQGPSHGGQENPWGEGAREGARESAPQPRPMHAPVPRMARPNAPLGAQAATLRRSWTGSGTIDLVA